MAKISIASLAGSSAGSELPQGLVCTGDCQLIPVIAKEGEPLHLHYALMRPGSELQVQALAFDCCAYVLSGSVEVNGTTIAESGCWIAERGSEASVGVRSEARLALFLDCGPAAKPGQNVHVIQPQSVPEIEHTPGDDLVASRLLADATCPSCDLWLHGHDFPGGKQVVLHSHSEDEIILVTSGEIVLGRRRYGPDTGIAIARDTVYQFRAGDCGLTFLNFRARSPTATLVKSRELLDEGEMFRGWLGTPQHTYVTNACT